MILRLLSESMSLSQHTNLLNRDKLVIKMLRFMELTPKTSSRKDISIWSTILKVIKPSTKSKRLRPLKILTVKRLLRRRQLLPKSQRKRQKLKVMIRRAAQAIKKLPKKKMTLMVLILRLLRSENHSLMSLENNSLMSQTGMMMKDQKPLLKNFPLSKSIKKKIWNLKTNKLTILTKP